MRKKIWSLFLLSFLSTTVVFAFTPFKVFLDNKEDDDQPALIFPIPGQNRIYCPGQKKPNVKIKSTKATAKKSNTITKKEEPVKCPEPIGMATREAPMLSIGPSKIYKTLDPISHRLIDTEYTKIQFETNETDSNGKIFRIKKTGYIESFYLSKTPTKNFYTAQNTAENTHCPPDRKNPQTQLKQSTAGFKDLAGSIANLEISKKADNLSYAIGLCPLKPPTAMPKKFNKKMNVYDEKILPLLQKINLPTVKNEAGKNMTRKELIEIDALARTLYGEMGNCFRRGLQYPMAVARIIINRAEEVQRAPEFIKGPHSSLTPPIKQVSTTPNQFSMWLQNINGQPNKTLHQGLCPPTLENQPYWKSSQASRIEYDIWKNTIRIATEAILHPKKFKTRTSEVTEYFYTSGLGKFFDMKQKKPTIHGKKIERDSCLEIWSEHG